MNNNSTEEPNKELTEETVQRFHGSIPAAWVIGPYLVLQTASLIFLAVLTAFAPDGTILSSWLSFLPTTLTTFISEIPEARFLSFQRNTLAACSAGLGGAVFMIREFYISFSYGRKPLGQKRLFLELHEIPRYVLLPLSSCVLGPVGLALLQAGAIVFSGFSSQRDVPLFTTVAVCFLLGFSYHDTLGGLRALSRNFWGSFAKKGK